MEHFYSTGYDDDLLLWVCDIIKIDTQNHVINKHPMACKAQLA